LYSLFSRIVSPRNRQLQPEAPFSCAAAIPSRSQSSAKAMEIPLYRLFYEGEEPPKKPNLPPAARTEPLWGTSGKEWPELRRLAKALRRMDERKRKLLLGLAQGMARRNRAK
jgi:hypothetical protein